ncbi:MAG: hypothetical protein QOI12_371 [Alphaproteobacteria bacterium]|jgi:hypothetical protein|nr:hypothetical protein [Alphaproteobacteria bacterium]
MSSMDYRQHANRCLRIAEETSDVQHRLHLIAMAQSWLLLERQAEKNLTNDIVYETPTPRERILPLPQQQDMQLMHLQQQQQQQQPPPPPKKEE